MTSSRTSAGSRSTQCSSSSPACSSRRSRCWPTSSSGPGRTPDARARRELTAVTNEVEPVRQRSWRRTAVSTCLVVVVVAAFGWALKGQWADIVEQLKRQHPAVVVLALLVALAGVFMSFLLWHGTLVVLGSSLRRRPAARLFFLTQLGKYLPGAVWPVLAQMRMGRDLG